jgi:hypothetical protein
VPIAAAPSPRVDDGPGRRLSGAFNVTLMTLWRWDHDPKLAELGWEPPVKIRTRNYRRRRPLEKFEVALRNFGNFLARSATELLRRRDCPAEC